MIFKNKSLQIANHKHNQQRSWKQKFKMLLYKNNYRNICTFDEKSTIDGDDRNEAAVNFINGLRQNYRTCRQNDDLSLLIINNPFCIYIPLKKSIQIDDEMINTFVYLRNLKEHNNTLEEDNFYTEVRKFLKYCKQTDKIQQGWLICLKRFIVGLDTLKRMQIFHYLLKYSSQYYKQLHKKYAKETLFEIFMERVLAVNRYFQKSPRINKAWKISVELNDKINVANISKTMKMLYCSLCMIYDCGKHKLQDTSHLKNHHYSSYKNIIPKTHHISKAIQLLKRLRDFQCRLDCSQIDGCSQDCYKKINNATFMQKQLLKSRLISPLLQSVISMGIQLFSYSPCLIYKLFPRQVHGNSKITCSIIFLYLIEEINLEARLDYKINENQVDFLKGQRTSDNITLMIRNANKEIQPLKKRKMKKRRIEEYKYQQIATCIHSYIGEQSFDLTCQACVCHERGFCLPQCQCGPDCSILKPGCSCKSKEDCQSSKCLCYKSKTECIPGICNNCFPTKGYPKRNICNNDQILRGMSKLVKIGFSKIPGAGFGAFAGQKIKKGSLILTYCGEVLDQQMEGIRQTLKKDESFYNFACSQGSIDARYMGNKTRFFNHGNEYEKKTNTVSLNIYSCGQQYIGLYALKDIQQGQQLLFDYDVEGQVAKIHSNMYAFLKKSMKIESIQ